MKIKKVTDGFGKSTETIVDEEYVQMYQDKKYFAVPNALELIKKGERIYSDLSYFELVKE